MSDSGQNHLQLFLISLVCLTMRGLGHADCLPTPSGLVGWWPGDGNASNVLGTNNGTLQGGATANVPGLVGSAFNFDGTNNFVEIPNAPILQPTNLTIEAWIQFTGLDSAGTGPAAGVQNIIFKQNTQSSSFEGYDLGKTRVSGSDYFRFIVSSGSGQTATIRSSTIISTGIWYHVAAVRGPNFTQLYVNGALERQTNVAFAQSYGTQPLYFGTTGQSYWDRRFKGDLDEVTIYNRALDSNEIAAVYAAGAAGKCKAPNITSRPQSQMVLAGSDVSFTVAATGFGVLNYQWQSNAVPILGATEPILNLTNVSESTAADYSVVITNLLGSVTSASATLDVGFAPAIATQPAAQTNLAGTSVEFFVATTGSPVLQYQWLFNGTNLPGATASNLVIAATGLADQGAYSVVITNRFGSVTSDVAQLTVNAAAVISVPPSNLAVSLGNDAVFNVVVTGDPAPGVQWLFNGMPLTEGGKYVGTTQTALTIIGAQTNDAGNYQLVATNIYGVTTSSVAVLTVNLPACAPVGSGLLAWWSGDSSPYEQKGGNLIQMLNGASFTTGKVVDAFFFDGFDDYIQVTTSTNLNPAFAVGLTLEAWLNPSDLEARGVAEWSNGPTLRLSDDRLVLGDGAGNIRALLLDTNGIPHVIVSPLGVMRANTFQHVALTYDQASGTAAIYRNGVALITTNVGIFTLRTEGALTFGTRTGGPLIGKYFRGAMDEIQIYNRALTATEIKTSYDASSAGHCPIAPVVTTQPQSQTVPAGTNVLLFANSTGSEPKSYQWLRNSSPVTDGGGFYWATTPTLYITNVQAVHSGDYQLVISNAAGIAQSDLATLTITPVPATIIQQPGSVTATRGAQVSLAGAATGSEPLLYQWLFNSNVLAGATAPSLSFANVQYNDAGGYALVVTNELAAVTSSTATLTVTPPPGFLWTRKSGGTGADEGRSVAKDAQGNIFVAGTFTGSANFGTNILVSVGFGSTIDLFVAKYDPTGQLLWVRSGGSGSQDSVNGIAVDTNGNVCIAGSVGSFPNFSGVTMNVLGSYDAFVAKYSGNGDLLWVTNFGGMATTGTAESASAVTVDGAGRIYVAGNFNGTGFFGSTIVSNTLSSAAFIARVSTAGDVEWVRTSSGSGTASSTSVSTDARGNVLVAGSFSVGYVTFGNITLTNSVGLVGVASSLDAFVAKYDTNGNIVWAHKAGGTSSDTARGIAVDGGGNSYIVGEFNGAATFGDTTLTAPGQTPDVFLMKCDAIGDILWAQRAGGTSTDTAGGVAVDGGGNVFITGSFNNSANFGGTYYSIPGAAGGFIGGTNITSAGGQDAFVATYTSSGELRWALKSGGTSTDSGRALVLDNLGGLFLSGSFSGTVPFGHQSFTSAGGTDFFLSKLAAFDPDAPAMLVAQPASQTNAAGSGVTLSVGVIAPGPIVYQWQHDGTNIPGATNLSLTLYNLVPSNAGSYGVNITTPNGNLSPPLVTITVVTEPDFLWAKHLGGTGNDECLAVAADANGNTYAAGYFSGTTDFGGTNLTSNGGEDVFVAKFDAAQNLIWLRQIGGTNDERANALALDEAGNLIIVGQFTATADFGGTNLTSFGSNDVFVTKLDNAGTLLWVRQAGGTGDDFARSVAVHTNGDIALTGSFQRIADFGGISVTNRILANAPSGDVFVARYDSNGQLVWVKGAGGTSDDRARSVAFDRAGNVLVAGGFSTSITFDSVTLSSVRKSYEIFIAKYGVTGNVLWARSPGTAANDTSTFTYDDEATALAVDRDANIFFAGYFQATGIFASNTVVSASTNAPDFFLAKYDDAGNALWMRTGGGVTADSALALTTDNAGNALVAGSFNGPAQFGGQTIAGIGGPDAFAAMFDSTGNLLKFRKLGGTGDDAAQAAAYDGRGNLVLGGFYTGPAVVGSTPLPGTGGRDAFLTKLALYDPDFSPVITGQPMKQTVAFGKTLDLGVGVTSGSLPSYQWLFNNAPLSGATNGTLRITNFQYFAAGDYSVIITNTFGAATSSVATVTVEIVPEFPWLQRAGSTGDDQALALAMDAQTNLYMAGYFSGTALFTNGIYGTNISLVSTGLTDIFVAKYNTAGKLLWAKSAGGPREEAAQSLAIDPAGNVLLTGYFRSIQASFGSLVVTNQSNDFIGDIFVAKYDPEGNPLWAKRAGGLGWDMGRSIATDAEGNAYITGFCYWLATFGNITLTNGSSNFPNPTNYFIAKYSSAGDMVWAKSAVGTSTSQTTYLSYGYIQGYGICLDAFNNVIVTGHLNGTADFGNGDVLVNNNNGLQGGSESSVFLTKYDPNGTLLWAKKGIGGTSGIGLAVRADSAGYLYATSHRPSFGTAAIVLSKYDLNGFQIWMRSVPQGNGLLQGSSLALDPDGNIMMAGGVTGTLTFEGTLLSGSGFVSKHRPDGMPLWVLRAGGWCYGVVPDPAGGAYLTGRYSGTGVFGPSGSSILAGIGGNDIFLVKLGVKSPTAIPQAFVKTIATDAGTTLQVLTSGTGPFAYQWQFNGSNIPGATGSSYLLSGAKWTNAGLYSVSVSNTAGRFTSAAAAVNVAPKLYSEPRGPEVKLTWDGQFTLQSAPHPTGPFTDLPGAASPYFYATGNDPLRFFRLKSAPFALTISNQPGGGLLLSGAGISGYNFILLTSTNLSTWTRVATNVSPLSFGATKQLPQQFYRAVLAQ